tara:strand:- start:581 stop:1141 length:561 start_codon:yes stop_codon:yes gene_type:complete
MKITKRQLIRLIEVTIKPSIPNIPSDDSYAKIDKLARDPEYQHMADSMADALGYPEDRSYIEDLKTYEIAGRETFDSVYVKPLGDDQEVLTIPIPYELTDKLIGAHEDLEKAESKYTPGLMPDSDVRSAGHKLRAAGMDIFRHIHDHLDDKYGRDNYDIYGYGGEGAQGYRGDKYGKAMERMGEFF